MVIKYIHRWLVTLVDILLPPEFSYQVLQVLRVDALHPWLSVNMWSVCLSVLFFFMRNCLCYMDGYYFMSNLISILSITASVSDIIVLEFPYCGASVCSGNSASCVYLSAYYVCYSSCDYSVSYYFYYSLVYYVSWSKLLSSSSTVPPSSPYSNFVPLRRFEASTHCLLSYSSFFPYKYLIYITATHLKMV